MLINRQKEILLYLYEHQDQYLPAKKLAAKHEVSLRTIKNDLSEIKQALTNQGAHLHSVSSKGHQLIIDDKTRFIPYLEENRISRTSNSYYEQPSRISHIMRELIAHKQLNPIKLENELFISRSTLSNDLKVIRKTFEKYQLQLKSSRSKGIYMNGEEKDIRRCIIGENLLRFAAEDIDLMGNNPQKNEILPIIKNILLEAFVNNKIVVSDHVFQNLVVHIYTSLWRMKNNHYLAQADGLDDSYQEIQLVAQEIMKNICRVYGVKYSQAESDLLAINIQGKRELYENEYISKEIDQFISQSLLKIKQQYQIDFLDDIDLRISLALHTNPLISRMNSNLLLKNTITYEIKQNYILVFDIASTYAYELYKKYNIKINDDEISFIALHFANAMQSKNRSNQLNILLISPEKKSNTFLVRQKFNQWFKNDIQSFDIINPTQMLSVNLHDYDAIFTTDRAFSEKYDIIYIDLFLDESNYQRIEFALNGFNSADDILSKFHEELFFTQDFASKTAVINFLCEKTSSHFDLEPAFQESVKEHENINASYFGHNIAILHPVSPITDTTFISTLILDKPINWDNHLVQFVLLVSIEKNNPKALSLWYYLSFLISNHELIDNIIKQPDFTKFSDLLLNLYKRLLGD